MPYAVNMHTQNKFLESNIECMNIIRGMNKNTTMFASSSTVSSHAEFNRSTSANANNTNLNTKSSQRCNKKCSNNTKGQPGFQAAVWGPGMWFFLHTISLNFPLHPTEADKKSYEQFLCSLGDVLPCSFCSQHYKDHLASDFDAKKVLKSRETLSEWLYKFHEKVNKRLHKKETIKYKDAMEIYKRFASDESKHKTTLVIEPDIS